MAQSVWRLATGWTIRGSNPVRGEGGTRFYATVQTSSEAHPVSSKMGTGFLPAVR